MATPPPRSAEKRLIAAGGRNAARFLAVAGDSTIDGGSRRQFSQQRLPGSPHVPAPAIVPGGRTRGARPRTCPARCACRPRRAWPVRPRRPRRTNHGLPGPLQCDRSTIRPDLHPRRPQRLSPQHGQPRRLTRHATGSMTPDEHTVVPTSNRSSASRPKETLCVTAQHERTCLIIHPCKLHSQQLEVLLVVG